MTQSTIRLAPDGRVGETVIDAVSEATGTDPLELPQIYEVVDLDAVERLFPCECDQQHDENRLEFAYAGCQVRVHADGRVVVNPVRSRFESQTASTGSC